MNRREFNRTILALGGLTLATPLVDLSRGGSPDRGGADHSRSDLEERIKQYIQQARKRGLIDHDEATSWSAYDFSSGTKLVSLNEDVPRECASMVKPFVALAFFCKAKEGCLVYDRRHRNLMELMIQRSSNWATNHIIDLVGGPAAVDRILHDNYPLVFHHTKIIEKIPIGGRTYMNQASARDYGLFLRAIWSDRLPYSDEIRRLMALPNRSRLYDGVPNIPASTMVYHKTGTTARLCGDFGLLVPVDRTGKRYPYTLVAIIERRTRAFNLTQWVETGGDVIRRVSAMVYDEIKSRYDLP